MLSPRLLLALLPGALWTDNGTDRRTLTVRGRWVVIFLVVGVALDLLISVVLISQNQQIKQAASSAHISRVAAYESCLASNDQKRADLERWDAIIKLLSTRPPSPQLEAFVHGVEIANLSADQPRDCQTVAP